jgi:hypothetical protein
MTEHEELIILRKVADIAAFCVIDLNSNLKDAHKEYMDGSLNKGSYQYVLGRHGALCEALHAAGYTERSELFDCPKKPTERVSSDV